MPKFSGTKRRPLRANLTAPIATTGSRIASHRAGTIPVADLIVRARRALRAPNANASD